MKAYVIVEVFGFACTDLVERVVRELRLVQEGSGLVLTRLLGLLDPRGARAQIFKGQVELELLELLLLLTRVLRRFLADFWRAVAVQCLGHLNLPPQLLLDLVC